MRLPPLILRRAEPADAARIALLAGATFLHAFAHDHPGDDLVAHVRAEHSQQSYARWLADPAAALWLIETPLRAPIGYALLAPPKLDILTRDDDIELKRIYVMSGYQGGGWGGKLLNATLAEAAARGAARILLCVYEHNVAAQKFYARHGFERIAAQRFMVGATPFTDYIFARPAAIGR